MLHTKVYSTTQRKAEATEATLKRIRQFAPDPDAVTAESIFIGQMKLCNDQVDRSFERFPESYLKRFAETMPGKSVLPGHDYRQTPLGRFFDGDVVKSGNQTDLVMDYYLLADDPITAKVKTGIARDVSIGFEPDLRVCDLCEKDYDGWWSAEDDDYCRHIAGSEYDVDGQKRLCTVTYGGDTQKVEGVEGSFVWLGCQYGAETMGANRTSSIAKAAHIEKNERRKLWVMVSGNLASVDVPPAKDGSTSDRPTRGKENTMPTEAELKAAQELVEKAQREREQAATNERLMAAGKAYYARLIKNIGDRYELLGMKAAGGAVVASLENAPIDRLEAAEAEVEKQVEAKFPQRGVGQQNHHSSEQESSGDRQFNPLAYGIPGRL